LPEPESPVMISEGMECISLIQKRACGGGQGKMRKAALLHEN